MFLNTPIRLFGLAYFNIKEGWKLGDYEKFKEKVYQLTKIDLSSYKERQMKRRIDSLITKNKIKSYDEYIEAIKQDKKMLDDFVTYLTINVSEFYRNPEQWKLLENEILPYLFEFFGNDLKIHNKVFY